MAEKVLVDKQFSLQARDFLKGAIMAIGTPVLILVQELIPNYDINIIYKAAISAIITYLLKNYFSAPSVTTVQPSNETAVAVGDKIEKEQIS